MYQRLQRDARDRDNRSSTEQDIKSLTVKKESSEGSGLLPSIDHNVTDAHTH